MWQCVGEQEAHHPWDISLCSPGSSHAPGGPGGPSPCLVSACFGHLHALSPPGPHPQLAVQLRQEHPSPACIPICRLEMMVV